MARPPVSVTIISLNEEENIARAIQSVLWADEVVVVDSGSTDRTVEIAKSLGAKVIHHAWPGYGQQKNFAQNQAAHDWILNLDADEEVPPELKLEIEQTLQSSPEIKGYWIPRKTFYLGRFIRYGGWYPNYLVRLVDRRVSSWTEPHVHEALEVRGPLQRLTQPFHHFAFASIHDQILTNLNFSRLGSQDLLRKGKGPSIFKMLFKPAGKFLETYFLKRGFLDGLAGLIISINAAHSMFLKYAYLMEAQIRRKSSE